MAKKSGVPEVGNGRTVVIDVDMEGMEVLEYNKEEGCRLVWDPYNFKELDEATLKELKPENLKAYYKAFFQWDEARKAEAKAALSSMEVMSPLVMNSQARLKIRERKGWHQCWKSPGADFDAAMSGPYKQVRCQKGNEEMPAGEENGEVKKLLDGEGKVELIAVECPLDLYERHIEAMAAKSGQMLKGAKEDFFRATEEINRRQRDPKARIIASDESGEN